MIGLLYDGFEGIVHSGIDLVPAPRKYLWDTITLSG